MLSQSEALALGSKNIRRDHHRFDLCQIPFIVLLEKIIEKLGHHETENRVPEKFETLIGRVLDCLDRRVGESLVQKTQIPEIVGDLPLTRVEVTELGFSELLRRPILHRFRHSLRAPVKRVSLPVNGPEGSRLCLSSRDITGDSQKTARAGRTDRFPVGNDPFFSASTFRYLIIG